MTLEQLELITKKNELINYKVNKESYCSKVIYNVFDTSIVC